MDATSRVNGLSHVAICAECAARLQDTKNISKELQFAAAAETEETPARVRESLLAAFAEHHNLGLAVRTVTPISKGSSWRTFGWWSAAAVAAAAAVILALMLPWLMRGPVPAPPTQTAGLKETKPTTIPPTPKPAAPTTAGPDKKVVVANNKVKPANLAQARKHRSLNRSNNEGELLAQNSGNQYFPLTYLDSATAMESGTVVRIQLSRSKLISLGLPMNGERANELVKADLVLGDDGVARAIRLVQ